MKKFLTTFLVFALSFLAYSCADELPVEDDISKEGFVLVDQDNTEVEYPETYIGDVLLVGYIFTNCPDICPLTTNNLMRIQERVKEEGIDGVEFAAISFDPDADTPPVLKKFADIRNVDMSNFNFYTGGKEEIDSLMNRMYITYVPSDTMKTPNGKEYVYFIHTDRIHLIDKESRIRKSYKGSDISIEEVIEDIKELTD